MRPLTWSATPSLGTGAYHDIIRRCSPTRRLPCSRYYSLQNITQRSRESNLVFHSTTDNPYHNLAIEHYLLTNSDPASRILLFYTNRPCVVIGRNQNPWVECDLKRIYSDGIDLVRRRSGGGTVFHDLGNLNFSILVPNDRSFSRRKHAEMVVRALKSTPKQDRLFEDIWVNERHDISIRRDGKDFKVSGSAFKLTRGRALHHGTLLHSSPNLGNISQFLRSPGRDYIQAKGVESVRSPVSNLFASTAHNELSKMITGAVTLEFEALYGQTRQQEVGYSDCQGDIIKGIHEIVTLDWKYGQTPRFDFQSVMINGKQVNMSVNRGVVEEASFGARPVLHEVTSWKNLVSNVPDEVINQLETIFPAIPYADVKLGRNNIIKQNDEELSRQLENGMIGLEERDQNTIREYK